ncbi:MAG: P1 family peptidase [Gemmatimonadota bacterium]|uniref:DmpA family aminopeptidase n=1 Tax=Candidatus Palauibacter scopulicola TaxID=3056741 RepID=UPI00238780B8|nr:P1 family peptidase [Candidatus Palauibacter scopulicola]
MAVLPPADATGQEARPAGEERPRAREAGVLIGRLPTGPLNAITDVPGVRVGHRTVWVGDSIRTGVTAILPHGDNVFERRVRAAIAVGNGFGKLVGLSQVNELGEIETPILLTGTLSVFRAADALLDTLLSLPANREVRSMNPVVGETNDGYLSDIRVRPIRPEHVREALRTAAGGPVEEGAVGAGTGTIAFGWKGGIGTSSRRVEIGGRVVNVGVLVQSNFGGSLRIDGVRVGEKLAAAGLRGGRDQGDGDGPDGSDGSVMIVIATDLPLAHRELDRVADRSFMGLARTGSYMSHGSGDYAIAFSTGEGEAVRGGGALSRVFEAVVEATDEAVINSLFKATSVTGHRGRTVEALPLEPTLGFLREAGVLGTPP